MGSRKSRKNVLSAIIVMMSVVAVAIWQFYTFVTFKNTNGMFDLQGGTQHFWWAVGFGLVACIVAVLFFSIFLRYDRNDETHIILPPSRKRLS